MRDAKILMAEAIGTIILMLGGPGTAVLAGERVSMGFVALAFGLALLVIAYTIGPVSGGHVNPAVTLGMVIMRKTEVARVPAYILGQVIGAIIGGFFVLMLAKGRVDGFDANDFNFATNQWGRDAGLANFWGMAFAEVLLTAVLVFVVLATTSRRFARGQAGLTVGMTLALIHLISIPIDNTSVNPVRSLGMAIYAGGDSLEQLWAFIVFPLVGAFFGVLAWLAVDDATLEDTLLDETPLSELGDLAEDIGDKVEAALDRAGDTLDDVTDDD